MGVIMGHENEHPAVVGVDIQIKESEKVIRKYGVLSYCQLAPSEDCTLWS